MDITTPLTTNTTNTVSHRSVQSTRSNADVVKDLPTTIKSEWIKVSSLRSNKAILVLTVAINGLVTWALSNFAVVDGDVELTVADVFTFGTTFTAVFAAVAGILVFSSEAQHGTLAPTLTAQPARWLIAVAKTIIAAAFGAVLAATGIAAAMGGAFAAGLEMGETTGMTSTALWAILFATLAAVLGLGLGLISRHATAAVSGLLVWWLVIENLLTAFVSDRYARFIPFQAGNNLVNVEGGVEGAEVAPETAFTLTENALVFGGYAAAALAIGTVLLYRRDN